MRFLQPTRSRISGDHLRGALPGLLLAALGLGALLVATGLPFRTPAGRPGAGFVPALVAGALLGLGLLLATTGARRPVAAGASPRAGTLLIGGVLAFGLLLPALGFLPAAWVAATLALLAAPDLPPLRAALGGAAIAAVAGGLFLGLLGIPAPAFGPR